MCSLNYEQLVFYYIGYYIGTLFGGEDIGGEKEN
jgi:hypothetical protein